MSLTRVLSHTESLDAETIHAKKSTACPDSEIIVLVIGESLRSDHLGLNGYPRNTTPYLDSIKSELISFPDVAATANWTDHAVPNIVSMPSAKGRVTLVQTFREAGFRTAWFSNQEWSRLSRAAEVTEHATSSFDYHFRKDAELLPLFEAFIKQAGTHQFIVLHMMGSHIPYEERYGAGDKIFSPTLSDLGIAEPGPDDKQAAINSYDNTIIATDKFLYRVIKALQASNQPAVMMFTSDHGEDLFDDARQRYMHAMQPPTRFDTHVPLIVWTSESYKKVRPSVNRVLHSNRGKKISHMNIFLTLLNIASLDWDGKAERREDDFSSSGYVEKKRWIFSPPGENFVDYDKLR
jgi:glucan phosphoethanolaminetransferase (alkaline phosphatase superfamily)